MPLGKAAEPMSGSFEDQPGFALYFRIFSGGDFTARKARDRIKSIVVLVGFDDLVTEGVVILVLDERDGIIVVIVVGQDVVVAIRCAHARFFTGIGHGVVFVVRRQDGLVTFLIDLGRGGRIVLLVLIAIGLLVDDLIFGVIGRIAAGTAATAAQLDRLFGVELGIAFGAVCRAACQVVEFRLTVRADLLGAQLGIGQGLKAFEGWDFGRVPCHPHGPLSKAICSVPGPA